MGIAQERERRRQREAEAIGTNRAGKPVTKGRRSSAVIVIPEDAQRPIRARLQLLRESRGLHRKQVEAFSEGTLQKFENHDLSSMRIGDLYGYAIELGIDFGELIDYIVSDTEAELTPTARRAQRMMVYLQSLGDEEQELACDIVARLVTHSVDKRERARIERTPGVKRDARVSVKQALAASDDS